MLLNLLLLVAPTLFVVLYIVKLRPVLHDAPMFRDMYAQADGFWQKVWALCGKSVTMAVGYVAQFFGVCLQLLDPVATLLGDPDLKQTITDALNASPKTLGIVLSLISAVVLFARVRSLFKATE